MCGPYRHPVSDDRAPVRRWLDSAPKELAIIGAFLVVLVVVVAGWWYASGGDERAARSACAEAVKGDIDNPASAQFTYELVWQENGTWHVNGHVDGSNRQSFTCDVKDGTVLDHRVV